MSAIATYEAFTDGLSTLSDHARASVVQVIEQAGRAGGAGVIWRADGRILTNHHVVTAMEHPQVVLSDGRTFPARVLAHSSTLDLALLQIEAENLPAALVGDSLKLRIGELVFAVGHPWGQREVVTAGVVSGLDTLTIGIQREGVQYIQTDTRLAPGNSGGPLLNSQGEVVGINAMIFGGDLSVAIPSKVVNDWIERSSSPRAVLGVHVQPVIVRSLRRERRIVQPDGLLVAEVVSGSAAERAGVQIGDVMLAAAGEELPTPDALQTVLARQSRDASLAVRVLRGGMLQDVTVQPDWTESPL